MTLLDRFRSQPRQKHPDAAVRLGFVQEIPMAEGELLAEIARDDVDAKVRRAAVAKLLNPAALTSVAKADADDAVREQAVAMLRDLALEAFEGVGEAESVAAVEGLASLGEPRSLATVAKSATRETVARRALDRISDPHMLGSIARHAEHEAVRRYAFEQLRDDREVLHVALNSEFRDPALAAVDHVDKSGDRHALEQIAARARNKSAAKRARTLIREREEREAQAREAAAAAAAAERAARAAAAQSEQNARADAERQAAADRDAEQAVARAAAAQAAAELEGARLREQQELQDARERSHREAAEREAERFRARLSELAEEASRVASVEDFQAARRQFGPIRREWADASGHATPLPEAAAKYTGAEAALAARESTAREHDQKARQDALVRLQQLATRVEALAAREDLSLKAGERALRDVRSVLGAMPQLPSKRDYDEVLQRLKTAQTTLVPKVQELREVAGWQRWANVGIQEQLCEKMEGLAALEDPEEIVRQVKDLQQQWRQAADVPRAQGELLWRRFKAAHDVAWTKCESHFAAQSEARAANLAQKTALAERAESLSQSSNWIQTAEEIKKLQAEWKTIGPVSRGQEKAIWDRFRAACDTFFTRRHADLAVRKTQWSENLKKKDELIAKAEALAESSDWEPAAAEIKRLQQEWKTIGAVKKSRSEALWQRFRAACDKFFTRYAQRHDIARGERVAAREAIVAEVETLAGQEAAPPDLAAAIRTLRGRWQQELALRGVDRERAVALDERFAAAFQQIVGRWPEAFAGTDLDPDANRKRMESLVKRMEDLAASLAGPMDAPDANLSPTTRLAAMLKDALAANTIGGKADNESRLRAASDEVRQAQASWSRIGPVPDETRRALADRFQRAIRRISERAGQVNAGRGMAGAGAGRR